MSYGTRRSGDVGQYPVHAVSLSLNERQTQIRTQNPRLRAAAGINPDTNQLGNWEPSYFPDVGTYVSARLRTAGA